MTLILSTILCLLFKASGCQLQCVKETLNDGTGFSISFGQDMYAYEAGDCIRIGSYLTFPKNKVTARYRSIWFNGDPKNVVQETSVHKDLFGVDTLQLKGLPAGEYEYGLKLEWECNEYVFPQRVRVSVSASTKRPDVEAVTLTEGTSGRLLCSEEYLCTPSFHWEWTKADGQSMVLEGDRIWELFDVHERSNALFLTPTAEDHNTNITCVASDGDIVTKTTITLTVKFPPRIVNGSRCTAEGRFVVCVCVSWGNPPAPITWPVASLTHYSVTSSSSSQTVNSTITLHAADYNTSILCISTNELGQAEMELPLQSYTENSRLTYLSHGKQKPGAALPWIIAGVSFSLNLVTLTGLIVCAYKWRKRTPNKPGEEMITYATLNRANVEEEYSVLRPQPK